MRFLLPVAGWLVLTGADAGGLAYGALVAAAAFLLARRLAAGHSTLSPLAVLPLFPRFLWRALLGGIDVAARALHPRMPLRPGWISVPTRLPRGVLRATIGGEFSLMPGALVAGSRGDSFLVHLLDLGTPVGAELEDEESRILKAAPEARSSRRDAP